MLVFAAHLDDEVLDGRHDRAACGRARRRDSDRLRHRRELDPVSGRDAGKRAQKEDEARRAAAELGVEDYVHLDMPDMRLDTLAHVEVNAVVEEHVRGFGPDVVYTPQPDVNHDHRALFDSVGRDARPVPGQTVRRLLDVCADVQHRMDAGASELVRPELVRRRHRRARAEARGLQALRDGAAAVPASTERARDPRRGRALRRELRCEHAEPFVLVRNLERPA